MINCNSCGRHLLNETEECPFCSKPTFSISGKLKAIGASTTAFLMAACYGIGPDYLKETGLEDTGFSDLEESDLDGDQVTADLDCDDLNPLINPNVPEKCDDGIDNNCDNKIDAEDPVCQ